MGAILTIAKLGLRLIYLLFRPFPVQNKVVMLSRESDSEPIDFQLIREELARQSPDTKVISFCRKMTKSINPVTYCLFLLKSLYHVATARVAVTDTYSIPLCVLKHKKELKILQVWHAVGAVKQFSYQCLDRPGGHSSKMAQLMEMHRNYDYIFCTSEATREIYAQAFDTPKEKILPIGMPRVDYILRPDPEIRSRYLSRQPHLEGKKLLLYLPTFRDGVDQGVEALVKAAAPYQQTTALLVKPHPLSQFRLPQENQTESGWSTYDLMKICDGVITDYSAASLETSLLGKPVYFYLFDKEEYVRRQGLNIDPEQELPLACCRDAAQMMKLAAGDDYDMSALHNFCQRYIQTADENNTANIAALICRLLAEEEVLSPV